MGAIKIRLPLEQPFLGPDGKTISRAWAAALNQIVGLMVQGPDTPVVDTATVKWDGTSGRLVK